MKHLPLLLLVVVLLTSFTAFADSVNYTNLNVNIYIGPNDGSGDNLGGTLVGTNVNLLVGGGTPYVWLNDQGYAPGSVGGGDVTIYFDYAAGTLGGQYYEGDNAAIGAADFNAGAFTLPTNGRNFTVSVPATLGLIVVMGCTDDNQCTTYNLSSKPGTLVLSFIYVQDQGLYYASSGYFTTTPEPSTLGLVAIGVAALAACKYSRNLALPGHAEPR